MTRQQLILTLFSFLLTITGILISRDCYSQDSTETEKILFIERTVLSRYQDKPTHRIFRLGDRVKIKRFSNDTLLPGKIESIYDSSIVIKGKLVFLKDIKSINVIRGGVTIGVGAAITAISIGLIAYGSATHYNELHEEYTNIGYLIPGFFGAIISIPLLVVGVCDRVAVRHYHFDKDFRIIVKNEYKKK